MTVTGWTPGRISAVLTALYGIMPWEQDNLSDDQIDNLIRELDFVRYLQDEVHLRQHFAKLTSVGKDEELPGRLRQLIHPPDSLHQDLLGKAWQAFVLSRYRLVEEEEPVALAVPVLPDVPPDAAAGLIAWCESGACPDDLWLQVVPHWDRVVSTAHVSGRVSVEFAALATG